MGNPGDKATARVGVGGIWSEDARTGQRHEVVKPLFEIHTQGTAETAAAWQLAMAIFGPILDALNSSEEANAALILACERLKQLGMEPPDVQTVIEKAKG